MSTEEQKKDVYVPPRKEDGSIDYDRIPDWVVSDAFVRKPYTSGTTDGYCEAKFEDFQLRSNTYLKDKVKKTAQSPMFRTLGINVINPDKKTYHVSKWVDSLREYIETYSSVYTDFFITNWQLPGPPHYNVVHLYGRIIGEGEDAAFDNAYNRFKSGNAAYRNARLKFFPTIVTGPWAVKLAASQLGGNRPCLIGNKLSVTYNDGPNYIEVNIDIGSSKIASTLNGLIIRSAKGLCVDECFLIESQQDDELPERFIGLSRFIHCTLETVKYTMTLPNDYVDEMGL